MGKIVCEFYERHINSMYINKLKHLLYKNVRFGGGNIVLH